MHTVTDTLQAAVDDVIVMMNLETAPGEPALRRSSDLETWVKWVTDQLKYEDLVKIIRTYGLTCRITNKRAKVTQIVKYALAQVE